MPGNVYYLLWQQKLLSVAQQLHQKVGFDLAHHVTFGRYWSPSGVRNLGIPFIWGPVGAAEYAPPAFLSELPLRDRAFEFIRDSVRTISHRDPALCATARAATIGIGVTREDCQALRDLGVRCVEQLAQTALTDDELTSFDSFPPPPSGPFRAICLGRLLHWKGFYLAIRAFAIFARQDPEAELWIVGGGPFRRELEKTAAQTGMVSRIRFCGHLPHDETMDKLAQSHVLIHPALHDNFPAVCLEAMAAGRPVVCLDLGGPASQVTAETRRPPPAGQNVGPGPRPGPGEIHHAPDGRGPQLLLRSGRRVPRGNAPLISSFPNFISRRLIPNGSPSSTARRKLRQLLSRNRKQVA